MSCRNQDCTYALWQHLHLQCTSTCTFMYMYMYMYMYLTAPYSLIFKLIPLPNTNLCSTRSVLRIHTNQRISPDSTTTACACMIQLNYAPMPSLCCFSRLCVTVSLVYMYMMRDEKEERKKHMYMYMYMYTKPTDCTLYSTGL